MRTVQKDSTRGQYMRTVYEDSTERQYMRTVQEDSTEDSTLSGLPLVQTTKGKPYSY